MNPILQLLMNCFITCPDLIEAIIGCRGPACMLIFEVYNGMSASGGQSYNPIKFQRFMEKKDDEFRIGHQSDVNEAFTKVFFR